MCVDVRVCEGLCSCFFFDLSLARFSACLFVLCELTEHLNNPFYFSGVLMTSLLGRFLDIAKDLQVLLMENQHYLS